MVDEPDLEQLAKQYMDLWQQQLSGMASDKELSETMARTLELMNAGAGSFATMLQAMPVPGVTKGGAKDDGSAGSENTGTSPAAAASGDFQQRLDEFDQRLTVLEQRITALEAGTAAPGGKAKPRPRKRKS